MYHLRPVIGNCNFTSRRVYLVSVKPLCIKPDIIDRETAADAMLNHERDEHNEARGNKSQVLVDESDRK